jgi:putative phosphoribosyl transferase
MFLNRKDAGIRLAERLGDYKDRGDALVLALPRGGVATGFEIAEKLNLRLDILIVRKIGFPHQPELAIGAVSETGAVSLNQHIISTYGVEEEYIEKEIKRQREEILRRTKLYRMGKEITGLDNKIVILTDDGVATGATIKAAISALKKERIRELIIALPVAPPDTANELGKMADKFICLETPPDFVSVGSYYNDFEQVSDSEVVELLEEAKKK